MKKKLVILFSIFLIGSGALIAYHQYFRNNKNTNSGVSARDAAGSGSNSLITGKIDNVTSNQSGSNNSDSNGISTAETLPDNVLIKISFLSQAPFGVWDPLHEDACEEASLIMVKHFLDKTELNNTSGDEEIKKMIAYEEEKGYGISITLNELNKIARDYYGMNTGRMEKNITVDNIKKELAAGRLVIVGAAGKILPNPNFRNGGPIYHMLVIKGYDSRGFITNDPGTRKGEGFRYTQEDLYNAIHDWNPENVYRGEKNYLVFD